MNLDGRLLDAFADELTPLEAEARLWDLERATWAQAAWDQAEIARRERVVERLVGLVSRRGRPDGEAALYDEQGRRILIGFEAVSRFLREGQTA